MRVVPYTTKSGLQIGCRYNRPAPVYPMSSDAERLQRGLLNPSTPRLAPLWRAGTWRWVGNAVLWLAASAMLVSLFMAALIV